MFGDILLAIFAVLVGIFVILYIIAKIKKGDSVYRNEPAQKNPMEGLCVKFVEDENDRENADGVKGHLEAVAKSEPIKGFYARYMKRIIDLILSFGGLVVLSPVFLFVIIAIKIDDPGPVLFTQKRLGQNKQYFKLHKFRSMKMCTPHDVPTHMLENPEQYITKVGKVLRKTSLDELPQIWDIFIGNMSVIGPRPGLWNQDLLTSERDKYRANDVKPGLTGWAQINGRDELEIPVKAKLDGEYVEKMSFVFDVKCFLGTILSVAKSDGVVEGGTGELKKQKESGHQYRLLLVANVAKEHVIKFHIPTIKMLKEFGWKVDVACSGEDLIPYCDNQYQLSYRRSPFTIKTFKGIRELKKIIDEGNYDIVYCHTPVGGLAGRVASINARKKGTSVVYFAHGYHFYKGAPKRNWMLYYPVEKILSKYTDAIITINQEDYFLTKEKYLNCQAYLVDGIGVDLERFKVEDKGTVRKQYRKQLEIPQDATVLIYLAELLENKNQTFLMDALKEILEERSNIYLVLAGFDHSNGAFLEYAKNLKVLDNVRFLGWREDVGNLYAMSDICTASSIREGFGLNLVEAMACKIPVIATRNRGHETIIKNGVNGYLVELDDVKDLKEKVLSLIDDKVLYDRFSNNGYKEVGKYSSDTILNNLKRILDGFTELGEN